MKPTQTQSSGYLLEFAICNVFMDAVRAHDSGKILELANAVAFFKDKLDSRFTPHDHDRFKVLQLRSLLGRKKEDALCDR